MKSIRLYLIIVLLSTICLVNFSAALNGYNRSSAAGNDLLDKRLISVSAMIERLYQNNGKVGSSTFGNDAIFQIWGHGTLLYRSDNAPQQAIAVKHSDFHIVNASGIQWRAYSFKPVGTGLTIIYGERYDLYRQLIDNIILESLLPIIWVLPIIGLLIWLIVGYGLKPVASFADKLRKRSENALTPIDSDGFPSELLPLLESTNTLFGRLSEAFEREQRFAADAAHELRTPLAALKVSLHNHAKSKPGDNSNITDLQESTKRMENSIEQILTLYKLAPDVFANTLSEHNVKAIAQQTLIELYPAIELKQQKIELDASESQLQTNPFALAILIKNLVENASKYTPNGGTILVTISPSNDSGVTIEVDDSGPGIDENLYDRVFDRFYRVGGDRHSSNVTGSGLGLSIVAHVVKLHKGHITLSRSAALGGLSVLVQLPTFEKKEYLL